MRSRRISCDFLHNVLFTVCRVCSEGVLCILMVGCGLRVGLGEAELARAAAGMLSCSMLLERPPFTSLPTLFRPMEEKKRRRKSFGRPSSFLYTGDHESYLSGQHIFIYDFKTPNNFKITHTHTKKTTQKLGCRSNYGVILSMTRRGQACLDFHNNIHWPL